MSPIELPIAERVRYAQQQTEMLRRAALAAGAPVPMQPLVRKPPVGAQRQSAQVSPS